MEAIINGGKSDGRNFLIAYHASGLYCGRIYNRYFSINARRRGHSSGGFLYAYTIRRRRGGFLYAVFLWSLERLCAAFFLR